MLTPYRNSIAAMLLLSSMSVAAQEQAAWTDAKGRERTLADLESILQEHEEWLASSGREGMQADLSKTHLKDVKLVNRNLSQAVFVWADLSNVILYGSRLVGANLFEANLENADLGRANLARATLFGANLDSANLDSANLADADLSLASCRSTRLTEAVLENANLRLADLTNATFEPSTLPTTRFVATAKGLAELRFDKPHAVVQLRASFQRLGFRQQEREITFAINRIRALEDTEDIFRYLLFQITCEWGLRPLLPLRILGFVVAGFALLYCATLLNPRTGRGIYRISLSNPSAERVFLNRANCNPFLTGIAFSLLSTLYVGWGNLSFQNWLVRLNPREYVLRASGWVGAIAGIQSILSVYLIVLWALVYFGRPF